MPITVFVGAQHCCAQACKIDPRQASPNNDVYISAGTSLCYRTARPFAKCPLQHFLMRRAYWLVRATAAEKSWLGGEVRRANLGCGFLHRGFGIGNLLGVACGFLPLVVLQVVKYQPHRVPF